MIPSDPSSGPTGSESPETIGRRRLLEALGSAGATGLARTLVPAAWITPFLATTLLPKHAHASGNPPTDAGTTPDAGNDAGTTPDAGNDAGTTPDAGGCTKPTAPTASTEGGLALASTSGRTVTLTVTIPTEIRNPPSQCAIATFEPGGPCSDDFTIVALVAPSKGADTVTAKVTLPKAGTFQLGLVWTFGSVRKAWTSLSVTVT
ncbi:MAG: hypothetical protein U0169_24860 [Polyangiaceae bacterium]